MLPRRLQISKILSTCLSCTRAWSGCCPGRGTPRLPSSGLGTSSEWILVDLWLWIYERGGEFEKGRGALLWSVKARKVITKQLQDNMAKLYNAYGEHLQVVGRMAWSGAGGRGRGRQWWVWGWRVGAGLGGRGKRERFGSGGWEKSITMNLLTLPRRW